MDKKKLVEKIKEQLKSLISADEKEVKFAQVKAGDLVISTPDDELTVGSEVMLLDESGVGTPLTDGKYVLDSGMEIVVEAGKVKEMMEKKEEEEEAPEVTVEVESGDYKKEEKMGMDTKMAMDMEEKLAKLEEKLAMVMDKLAMMGSESEMMKKELSAIASTPSTQPIDTKSVEFRSVDEKKNGIGLIDVMSIRDRARKNNR